VGCRAWGWGLRAEGPLGGDTEASLHLCREKGVARSRKYTIGSSHEPMNQGTEFEKPRGVSHVEVRHGFAQVHVSQITGALMAERLNVLRAVADAGVSIDFLKMTQSGLSFLVPEDRSGEVETALKPLELHFKVLPSRSIVLVYAVNMRDEEGLIAAIIRDTISSGARVNHVGDMHDRMLLVVDAEEADRLASQFESSLMGAGR
jgi:aspartokinase